MAQVLTKDDVRKAIKAAMRRGKLGAQKLRRFGRYKYADGTRCAIGCALSDETLRAVLASEKEQGEYFSVYSLTSLGFVVFPEGHSWFSALQEKHDDWAKAKSEKRRVECRKQFLEVLNS